MKKQYITPHSIIVSLDCDGRIAEGSLTISGRGGTIGDMDEAWSRSTDFDESSSDGNIEW